MSESPTTWTRRRFIEIAKTRDDPASSHVGDLMKSQDVRNSRPGRRRRFLEIAKTPEDPDSRRPRRDLMKSMPTRPRPPVAGISPGRSPDRPRLRPVGDFLKSRGE